MRLAAVSLGRRQVYWQVKANVFFQPSQNNTHTHTLSLLPRLDGGGLLKRADGNTRRLTVQSVVCRPDQATDLVPFDSGLRVCARARLFRPESKATRARLWRVGVSSTTNKSYTVSSCEFIFLFFLIDQITEIDGD